MNADHQHTFQNQHTHNNNTFKHKQKAKHNKFQKQNKQTPTEIKHLYFTNKKGMIAANKLMESLKKRQLQLL